MYFMILTFLFFFQTQAQPISKAAQESNIKKLIFNNNNYDNSLRPSDKVNIDLKLHFKQLISLNIPNQIVTTSSNLLISWIDTRLQWTPSNFSNVSQIQCQTSFVWLPSDLYVKNTADSNGFISFANYKVSLYNTGLIFINLNLNGNHILKFIADIT